jgi:hypothetical protein
MDIYKEIKELRKKHNAHIIFSHDIYEPGNNCLFSIIFNNDRNYQTGTYGDNHEFGETEDVMVAAVHIANFMLSDPKYLEAYFSSMNETATREGHALWCKYHDIKKEIDEYIFGHEKE